MSDIAETSLGALPLGKMPSFCMMPSNCATRAFKSSADPASSATANAAPHINALPTQTVRAVACRGFLNCFCFIECLARLDVSTLVAQCSQGLIFRSYLIWFDY